MTTMAAATPPAYTRLVSLMRPHRYHVYLILYLVVIMLVGTLVSLLLGTHMFNVTLSNTRALDVHAGRLMESQVPHMFADRRNPLNQFFIKRAWLWNTACVVLVGLTLKRTHGSLLGARERRGRFQWSDVVASQTFWRWIIATVGWLLCTQWFFGPSVSERVFLASGGQCLVNSVAVDASLCRTRQQLMPHLHSHIFEQLPPTLHKDGQKLSASCT